MEKFDLEEPKEEVKQMLNAPISKEEIEKAITELKLNKVPGSMDFQPNFIKP